MNPITLFENGKDIQEGDKFVAHISSVEGHRKVTLFKIYEHPPYYKMKCYSAEEAENKE